MLKTLTFGSFELSLSQQLIFRKTKKKENFTFDFMACFAHTETCN